MNDSKNHGANRGRSSDVRTKVTESASYSGTGALGKRCKTLKVGRLYRRLLLSLLEGCTVGCCSLWSLVSDVLSVSS